MASPESAFAGSIPALYERHLGPLLFAPYATELARRLGDLTDGAVLETAAGTGIVTAALASALPAAVQIAATDLNDAMIAVASAKDGMERVRWSQADALALPFDDAAFDAVVCSFGVMFYPDKSAGYAEALRVLRPGGRHLVTIWDSLEHNDLTRIVDESMAREFPDDPPDFITTFPFGYANPDLIRAQLEEAGFSAVGIETVELPCRAESASQAAIGICQGTPLRMQIEARGGDLESATAHATAAVQDAFGAGPIVARMQALLVTAVR
ncbi:MAG: SAM-dependent methyltransferase [Naasia sp.]|jgi:SAM-dependent methyltransferase|uniref:class I SAM-dependent methyltransferase n=1 Tax=Naasia sp. TaxID=2546198 RepID=UPI002617D038|nr:methyltransferase domain-containing protein [Naasia sp.]MCU1571883.1 SAM-dependent methyltransferase [Naasia sp.]